MKKYLLVIMLLTLNLSDIWTQTYTPVPIKVLGCSNETYEVWDMGFDEYSVESISNQGLNFTNLTLEEVEMIITMIEHAYRRWDTDRNLSYRTANGGNKTYVISGGSIIIGELIPGYGFRPLLFNPSKT